MVEMSLLSQVTPMGKFYSSHYLGMVVAVVDSNWTSIHGNIPKARCRWYRISSELAFYYAPPSFLGVFCKVVLQLILALVFTP